MTTVRDLRRFKLDGRRFPMLTAYDATTARLLDEAGIPILLVGDSVGMVVVGYSDTLPVTLDQMVHHCAAVARGVRSAMLVGDLPFGSYQGSVDEAVGSSVRLLKEGGMHAVKLEGGGPHVRAVIGRLSEAGIPVMAHLGLTPQSVHQMGGFRIQGRDAAGAERILAEALAVEGAGAFSLVLEGVPAELARQITSNLAIPTIGIGAGPHTDGQVLVVNDLLGLTERPPSFARRYADLAAEITRAARAFIADVEAGEFPERAVPAAIEAAGGG